MKYLFYFRIINNNGGKRMINVHIEDVEVSFTRKVGEMTSLQIEDFINLIKKHGVKYSGESYEYIESYFDVFYEHYIISICKKVD